jgi:membrane protease YdiL (CAAX protease family)
MSRPKSFFVTGSVTAHPVVAYFALTFAISWGGALLVISGFRGLSAGTPTSDPRFVYAVLAMLAGPSISGILLTALMAGRTGLRELGAGALEWRVGRRWLAAAVLTAPLLWAATLAALSFVSPSFLTGVYCSTDRTALILLGVSVALGVGVCEEIGWTGFAVPQLRRGHGVFATGLIVGILWGAWHLLTNVFWTSRVSAGDLPLSIFLPASLLGVPLGYLAAFRVLMVWVYDHTRSVLIAMLMHASLTASVLIMDPAAIMGVDLLIYSIALAAVAWLAVAVIGLRTGWSASQRP